jgi:hypothetical protein
MQLLAMPIGYSPPGTPLADPPGHLLHQLLHGAEFFWRKLGKAFALQEFACAIGLRLVAHIDLRVACFSTSRHQRHNRERLALFMPWRNGHRLPPHAILCGPHPPEAVKYSVKNTQMFLPRHQQTAGRMVNLLALADLDPLQGLHKIQRLCKAHRHTRLAQQARKEHAIGEEVHKQPLTADCAD